MENKFSISVFKEKNQFSSIVLVNFGGNVSVNKISKVCFERVGICDSAGRTFAFNGSLRSLVSGFF